MGDGCEEELVDLKIFRPDQIHSQIMVDFIILLTYGVSVPFLALLIAVSVCVKAKSWRLALCRYYYNVVVLSPDRRRSEESVLLELDELIGNSWLTFGDSIVSMVAYTGTWYLFVVLDVSLDQDAISTPAVIIFVTVILAFPVISWIITKQLCDKIDCGDHSFKVRYKYNFFESNFRPQYPNFISSAHGATIKNPMRNIAAQNDGDPKSNDGGVDGFERFQSSKGEIEMNGM